ncbi:MAG: hypothetical protein K9K64_09250 [Desulfohalobiaceae bacterium]|nr:hypothetical protein [Desulfohalobiaceae bacterium]
MKKILIRAEDKNPWEKRAPLVPEDVSEIMARTGGEVLVQKSAKRFFREDQYQQAGAGVCRDMSPGDIILGIKEIPEDKLLPEKTYLFFSHTIKGQAGNMPLLKKIMAGGSTLIDYERIVDDQNRRLVYFGRYAGDAGALDILALMGEHWKQQGLATPFSECRRAVDYASVQEGKDHLRRIGREILDKGLPRELCPLVIGVLGYGNVSAGAQQIFDCLPVRRIAPEDLHSLAKDKEPDPHAVYLTVFKEKDLVRPKEGQFSLRDYYDHPENYQSCFEDYLPHVTILVNAVYWDSRYPKFVTWEGLRRTKEKQGKRMKLKAIADISCDVGGAVECTVKTTDTGKPAYLVEPRSGRVTDGHLGEGIVVLAVDNLPAELPNDSSTFFSNQLKGFLPSLLQADLQKPLQASGLVPEMMRAVIVHRGELTPGYRYLEKHL